MVSLLMNIISAYSICTANARNVCADTLHRVQCTPYIVCDVVCPRIHYVYIVCTVYIVCHIHYMACTSYEFTLYIVWHIHYMACTLYIVWHIHCHLHHMKCRLTSYTLYIICRIKHTVCASFGAYIT